MSGHSTEQVMELSLDVIVMIVFCHLILMIMIMITKKFYVFSESTRYFTDSSSDSGNSSDGNSDDDFYMQEQHIAQNFPDKPMMLVPSPAEYDEDFYNDWTLLENGKIQVTLMASLPSQEQWQQQSLELRLWTTLMHCWGTLSGVN